MRAMILTGAAALLSAPLPASPGPAFAAIAAQAAERIDLTDVPVWQSGRFRLGIDGTVGHVRRRSRGASRGAPVLDPMASDAERAGAAQVVRDGSLRFTLDGPSAGAGTLAGDCRFDRMEEQVSSGARRLSAPVVPMRFECRFLRDGAPAGALWLTADPGEAAYSARAGMVRMGDSQLKIRSLHRVGSRGIVVDMPVGYAFATDRGDVAAVDLNSARRRRLALPADRVAREAALAAGVALALFWDPGDTDD